MLLRTIHGKYGLDHEPTSSHTDGVMALLRFESLGSG